MSVLAASPGRQLADGDGAFPSAFTAASPAPRVLSRQQIDEFKREGVLVLRNFVGAKQVASWRAQGWAKLGVDPADPATWSARRQISNDDPLTPHMGELPEFQALMAQLGGGHFTGGGNSFIPVWPRGLEDKSWAPAATGHIDGYNTAWRGTGHHRACVTVYLNDVREGQGCFTVWKGGARRVHSFFRANPEQLDGRFYSEQFFKDRGWNALHDEGGSLALAVAGTQFVGAAGDCILWHGSCPHSVSANRRAEPRLAMIAVSAAIFCSPGFMRVLDQFCGPVDLLLTRGCRLFEFAAVERPQFRGHAGRLEPRPDRLSGRGARGRGGRGDEEPQALGGAGGHVGALGRRPQGHEQAVISVCVDEK
jgi:hypothetical protein